MFWITRAVAGPQSLQGKAPAPAHTTTTQQIPLAELEYIRSGLHLNKVSSKSVV